MFGEHMLVFVPLRIELSYNVKKAGQRHRCPTDLFTICICFLLPDEIRIGKSGNTIVGGIYPNVSCRYTVNAGSLYGLAYDLHQLAVLRAVVDDLVLIIEARCRTDSKISALQVLYGSPAVSIVISLNSACCLCCFLLVHFLHICHGFILLLFFDLFFVCSFILYLQPLSAGRVFVDCVYMLIYARENAKSTQNNQKQTVPF